MSYRAGESHERNGSGAGPQTAAALVDRDCAQIDDPGGIADGETRARGKPTECDTVGKPMLFSMRGVKSFRRRLACGRRARAEKDVYWQPTTADRLPRKSRRGPLGGGHVRIANNAANKPTIRGRRDLIGRLRSTM